MIEVFALHSFRVYVICVFAIPNRIHSPLLMLTPISLHVQEATRIDSLDCVRELASRKAETVEVSKKVLVGLESCIASLASVDSVWTDSSCCEMVCQALTAYVTNSLDRIMAEDSRFQEGGTQECDVLVRLIQLLTQLLQLPFIQSTVILSNAWIVIYKQDRIKAAAGGQGPVVVALQQALPLVLEACTEAAVKVQYKDGSFVGKPELDEEFVDLEDYLSTLHQLRTNLSQFYPVVGAFHPAGAVEFIQNRLTRLINQYGGATNVDAYGEAYAHLEGFNNPVTRLMSTVPEPKPENPQSVLMSHIAAAVSVVVQWQTMDPLLLYCQCLLMEAFKRFYRHLGPQLWAVMERLFSYMEYRDPPLVGVTFPDQITLAKSLTPEAHQIRRRAVSSCVEICNTVPDMLLPYLANLCDRVRQTASDMSDGQMPQMVEMLVVVANAIPNYAEKRSFLADVVGDVLKSWTSNELAATLISVDTFLAAMQVTTGQEEPEEQRLLKLIKYSLGIQGALQTFLGVGRRLVVPRQEDITSDDSTKAAFARAMVYDNLSMDALATVNAMVPLWTHIFPPLISLLAVVHELWSPETRRKLIGHPEACHVVSMPDEEIKSRLTLGALKTGPEKYASITRRWAMWINHVRQFSYQLISQACGHKVSSCMPNYGMGQAGKDSWS